MDSTPEARPTLAKLSTFASEDTVLSEDSVHALPSTPPHTQFATLPASEGNTASLSPNRRLYTPRDERLEDKIHFTAQEATPLVSEFKEFWTPVPLRKAFWISFIVFIVLCGIGLQVALAVGNSKGGWEASGIWASDTSVGHYLLTIPPVIVAAFIAAMWAWTDLEIKKLQPYVDLVHGDSPPHKSLLLDYTRTNNFIVWTSAAFNRHYIVSLTSLMVVLTLVFQPLSAALLVVRDTWRSEPGVTLNTLATVGLNNAVEVQDLTSFLTAAGFASASVLFNLAQPPFTFETYTLAPFELPLTLKNGTAIANTTAIMSDTGCLNVETTMVNHTDGTGWTNSASHDGCSLTWEVDKRSRSLFGTSVLNCTDNPQAAQYAPVVFWFFTYEPKALSAATFCYPSISIFDVTASVDLASGNVTSVIQREPFSSASNYTSLAGNVTGAPLNGRAYNGIEFDLSGNANPSDPFVLARRDATQLQMPAAVFQSAQQLDGGLLTAFADDKSLFTRLSNEVYLTYLQLVARTVYFIPNKEPITVEIQTFRRRLWLVKIATHLLTAGLFTLAVFAIAVHLFHRHDRSLLRLQHQPGTIASAVSIAGSSLTGMGQLLTGAQRDSDMSNALRDKKFRIDPMTMKILMQGERGYNVARSPTKDDRKRNSVFAAMQGQRRMSLLRWSPGKNGSTTPTSPKREV